MTWQVRRRSFKRAIELDPKYATAHQWYAELLSGSSRYDEAIREITKAVELDPFSIVINQQMVRLICNVPNDLTKHFCKIRRSMSYFPMKQVFIVPTLVFMRLKANMIRLSKNTCLV